MGQMGRGQYIHRPDTAGSPDLEPRAVIVGPHLPMQNGGGGGRSRLATIQPHGEGKGLDTVPTQPCSGEVVWPGPHPAMGGKGVWPGLEPAAEREKAWPSPAQIHGGGQGWEEAWPSLDLPCRAWGLGISQWGKVAILIAISPPMPNFPTLAKP